ncbi:MAG TPA: hypothetical protein VF896_13570 [Anaerolineales bacterium]
MWKFGSLGLKLLKMSHILLIVLFLGGISSSFALLMKLDLSNYNDVYMAYKTFNIISDNVVRIGAQGTILLGAILVFLQNGDLSNISGSQQNGYCLLSKLLWEYSLWIN